MVAIDHERHLGRRRVLGRECGEVALDVREARVVADASHRLQQRGGGGEEERGKTEEGGARLHELDVAQHVSARWIANRRRTGSGGRRSRSPAPTGSTGRHKIAEARALTAAAAADEEDNNGAPRSLTHTAASPTQHQGAEHALRAVVQYRVLPRLRPMVAVRALDGAARARATRRGPAEPSVAMTSSRSWRARSAAMRRRR